LGFYFLLHFQNSCNAYFDHHNTGYILHIQFLTISFTLFQELFTAYYKLKLSMTIKQNLIFGFVFDYIRIAQVPIHYTLCTLKTALVEKLNY